MNTLMNPLEVAELFQTDEVIIFDCRFSLTDKNAGLNAYNAEHIAGAYYVDMEVDLSAPHQPGKTGRHPLPDKQQWLNKIGQWGVKPEFQIVVYDDTGGSAASRMWWMLRWAGHENVSVLDGGIQAWIQEGLPTNSDIPLKDNLGVSYPILPELIRLCDADQIDKSQQQIIDARDEARYRGDVEPVDPVAGHVPGAICMPYLKNLNSEGRFLSKEELELRFKGISKDKDVVCYCGSGVTACHNILALVHAGFPEPILYAGSWSDWITDSEREIETGQN